MFLSTLNRMGMGDKNKLELIIEEEVADFCCILKEKLGNGSKELQVRLKGTPVSFRFLFFTLYFSDLPTIWSSGILCLMEVGIWNRHEPERQKKCLPH